jgi:Vault protein inter-alpha-trypsin domain
MCCRSILKWIGLTALSLTIVFLLSTIAHDERASAAIDNARPQSQGSLQILDQSGKPAGECPLKHTQVKAQVSGFLSRVTVTQDFENNRQEKIEAVYTFPLPREGAVDDLTMLIGERVIKGKIMRRGDAKAAYENAKQIGRIASLLDQERPNIFTQQVANIMPGQSVRIVISYVETLKYENGSYEWSFPMVVGPRYLPAPTEQEQQENAARISSPSAAERVRAGHDISLEIDLDAGMPIVAVNSETHETEVQQINEKRAVVRLKDHATIPNKDFLLTYRVAGDTINDAVLAHRSERGGFFTLILQPPQRVAAEDVMPKELVFVTTGAEAPAKVEVEPDSTIRMNTAVSGSISATVTVTSGAAVQMETASLGTTITPREIQELPLQGRSYDCLVLISPGAASSKTNYGTEQYGANISVNGQRPSSNSFTVDGVSANFGIAPGGESPGASAAGNVPALTAIGGGNALATFDSIQELNVKTVALQPEYGHVAGAHVDVITRSGTNNFHGSLFHFFGNDALDANDWFANSRGLRQPPKRLNIFGGTLGGPFIRDHTFFFASYEGLRLRQPMAGITDVPSLLSRTDAPAELRSFLNAFPLPNGPLRSDGFAEFASSFANPAGHDIGSIKIDQTFSGQTMLRLRYNFADSDATRRGPGNFSLNTVDRVDSSLRMISGSLSHTFSPNIALDLRANYSRARVSSGYWLDEFGGATVSDAPSYPAAFTFDLNSRNAALMSGSEETNLQRQFNLLGSIFIVDGKHAFKFGGDFRRLSPVIDLRTSEKNVLFDGVEQALTGVADRINHLHFADRRNPVFKTLSLFAQDEWRPSSRMTLNYGVRWELAPPPSIDDAFAVDQVDDPATLNLAPRGSSLWKTRFLNFAPRAAIAYQLYGDSNHELLLRGGAGILYDLGQDRSGDIVANSIPFVSGTPADLPLLAFDPQLKVPYVINWNVSLQTNLGDQTLSATYLGSSGKRLFHTETLLNQNPDFNFLRLTTNRGNSDYRALQVQLERRVTNGFGARASYTWAQSLDNVSPDSARRVIMTSVNPAFDRGPSDFDVRHQLTGLVTYSLPAAVSHGIGNKLSRNWTIDSIFIARSARPLNVVYLMPTTFGVAYLRPDVVSDSFFVSDPNVAGGRRLNPAAFVIPEDLQQGDFSRNSLRGFQFSQVDLALRRKFNFSEAVALQIQADAFNVFNHANFEDPSGNDLVVGIAAFGQSTAMSGRSLSSGGFPSFYSFGGPRALRFSVKLMF